MSITISRFWSSIQSFLFSHLEQALGPISETDKKLASVLELLRIEDFVPAPLRGFRGKPEFDRRPFARAFVAKAVLGLSQTKELIEVLGRSETLRRICGWGPETRLPSEPTFSRVFAELSDSALPQRVHESLVKKQLGDGAVGHLARDATAIVARERPALKERVPKQPKRGRGRPHRGETVTPKSPTRLQRQRAMTLEQMIEDLPTACDRGCKKNSKGRTEFWVGYKLHSDVADCGVPISLLFTSASTYDNQAAIPLAVMSSERVTAYYDLMDAAYDAGEIREQIASLGRVSIIDPRKTRNGVKPEMEPAQRERFKSRTAVERFYARLKDEFGIRTIFVRGPTKVFTHLMFAVLALAADQLLRLVT